MLELLVKAECCYGNPASLNKSRLKRKPRLFRYCKAKCVVLHSSRLYYRQKKRKGQRVWHATKCPARNRQWRLVWDQVSYLMLLDVFSCLRNCRLWTGRLQIHFLFCLFDLFKVKLSGRFTLQIDDNHTIVHWIQSWYFITILVPILRKRTL